MKKIITTIFISLFFKTILFSQSIGFSYFFPENGYFSNPIAPVSLNLPLKFNNYFQITPGVVMNHIGGMSMTGFPSNYDSNRALVGPFQTFELNLVPTINIPMKNVRFDLMGGFFGFVSFNEKIISGNLNQMIIEKHGYDAINSNISIDKSSMGWGYLTGMRFNFRVTSNIWAYIGGSYYFGSQKMPLTGSYTAYENDKKINKDLNFSDTELLYRGFSLSVGVSIK